ncbi:MULTISPECIES: DNA double-strand break repair nuclease NurA [Acidianus]|uniref:NurA domain-containing protein n=1 Tax=Candidatus Acidianus copahuensis TaxID=1160895 RepID=A0A031LKL5_9CREN|nr:MULTISPECIES: DNA double-strand break repair nuclease NurA [Acidianus]EZQ01754.1 hypothetical protein CM19_12310 [Candidatus Acidianus copahuensis]NON61448.1 DNA double-strand break repair nuclease NurA [Acidianus sp. RZ1]
MKQKETVVELRRLSQTINKAYEELVNNYSEIKNKISVYSENLKEKVQDEINRSWRTYTPAPKESTFLSIDGGEFLKEFRVGSVAVVNAEALLFDGENYDAVGTTSKILTFSPGNLAKERTSEVMAILEVNLAIEHADKSEFVLMDGSFAKKLEKAKPGYLISNSLDEILSMNGEKEMLYTLIAKKQAQLAQLISKYRGNVLWISKNSKGNDLFNQNISDVGILEALTEEPGYTLPIVHNVDPNTIINSEETRPLNGLQYSSFYLRLDKNAKVLKVDIVGIINEQQAKDILDILSSVSVNGYPYPLLKVHFDVKVSREDRRRILQIIGVRKRGNSWWPNQLF